MSTFTFEGGRVAMSITGPWRIPDYQLLNRFNWNIALVPKGPAGRQTRYAGTGMSIWKDTPWDEEVFVRAMDYEVRLFPQELWWEDLYRRMLDELDAALTGREPVEESLRQAHEMTNAYLARVYDEEENL